MPVIPDNDYIKLLGDLIYPNLENGIVVEDDRKIIMSLADGYIEAHKTGAVLLGCTEIPLAIKKRDLRVPVLNTADIHINEIYIRATQD